MESGRSRSGRVDRAAVARDHARRRPHLPRRPRERLIVSSGFELELPQRRVEAAAREQLVMRAALAKAPAMQDEDLVRVAHGRESMRDDQHGAAAAQPAESLLHAPLRQAVDRGRRLVEQQHDGMVRRLSAGCAAAAPCDRRASTLDRARRGRNPRPASRAPSRARHDGRLARGTYATLWKLQLEA